MSDSTISRAVRLLPVVVALLVLAASLATRLAESSEAAVSSTMHATVGPGFTISLTYADGSAVTEAPPGTYTIIVDDRSEEHNFHIFGPGVEETTAVGSDGSATWRVTLRNNSLYYFQCDPHPDAMYGRIEVGTPTTDSSPGGGGGGGGGGGTPVVPSGGTGALRGTLDATITATARLTIRLKGKTVTKVKQGRYRLAVSDKSPRHDVTLRSIGGRAAAITGVRFTGKRTVTVALTPGRWKLYSGVREAETSTFFVVTK
jgi:plastocyanin